MTVELMVILTSWPTGAPPANPLAYLRARRGRMQVHAPWPTPSPEACASCLSGRAFFPLLSALSPEGKAWPDAAPNVARRALALVAHVEAAQAPVQEAGPTPQNSEARAVWQRRPAHGVLSP